MRFITAAFLFLLLTGCAGADIFRDLSAPPGGPAPIFLLDELDNLEPVIQNETVSDEPFVRIDTVRNGRIAARSLTNPVTGAFRWKGSIPENARLEMLIGIGDRPDPLAGLSGRVPPMVRFGPTDVHPPRGVRFSLEIGGEKIFEREIARDFIGEWFPVTVNLEEHAGEDVELVFLVEGVLGGTTLPYWGHPSILAPRENPRRVIFFGLDTVPCAHVGFMGYKLNTTPNLDRLASKSTVFNNAQSCSPWTVPAFSTVLSGRLPGVTGTDRNNVGISDYEDMLAEVFRRNGFATSAFANIAHLQEAGFLQGYDHQWEGHDFPAGVTLDAVIDWIEKYRDQDFFTFIHLYDPHYPYAPPEEWIEKFRDPDYDGDFYYAWIFDDHMMAQNHFDKSFWNGFSDADKKQCVALFDAEIAWMDDAIEDFLWWMRAMEIFDDSLIVVFADHGEEFGEHGGWEHGHTQFQELVHVPFFIRMPGQTRGWRVDGVVGTADLYPTMLELFGMESKHEPYGESLVSILKSDTPNPEREIISESMLWGDELKSITDNRFKYIYNIFTFEEQLYDLKKDPSETVNLATRMPDIAESYREKINRYIDETLSGWHIRFLSGPNQYLSVNLTISSEGKILDSRLVVQKLEGSG
ncbi:MAG TPA: DUF229 domain-containing protein, partial [Firmicutes bacterium]|nr:DUF229 domain-containing protein [Bacillota bacterium]